VYAVRQDILEHEFVSDDDPANVGCAVCLNCIYDQIPLTIVRRVVVVIVGIICEVYFHVDFCLLDGLKLRGYKNERLHAFDLQKKLTTRAD
jgi:hypothetical protein